MPEEVFAAFQMEPSKLNLKCAETILSRYKISNPKVARDIALTIDQAEEAAAFPLREEIHRLKLSRNGWMKQAEDERRKVNALSGLK